MTDGEASVEHVLDDQRIMDSELAHEAALLEDAGYREAEELGVRSMAAEVIEVHAQRYSVAEAIAKCPPFAQNIRSIAKHAPAEAKHTIITGMIKDMADEAAKQVPDAVARRQAEIAASNKTVKKN